MKTKLDLLIKFGIAAILIAVPLYPKFPFINVPGTYVSIRIEDFLILSVAVIWLGKNIKNILVLLKNPILRAIILFVVTGLVATLSGIVFLHTASLLIGILEWGRRVEYLIGFIIALTSVKSIKDVEFYVKCVGIVLFLVFIIGIAQKYFAFPVITTQNSEYSKGIALQYVQGGHLASTFAGHYDLATYVILTSPIFVALYFVSKKNIVKGVVLFIIAASFWLMVNAASRISAVSYVVSVSTTLFLLRKYKYIPLAAIITLIFAFSTSNLFDRYLNIFNVVKEKLSSLIPTAYARYNDSNVLAATTSIEDRSTSIRLNIEWPRAIRAFLKNSLLGTGYSSITLATDNDYLRTLGEIGILGFVSTFFVHFRIIKELIIKSWPKGILSKKEINFRTAYLAGVLGCLPGIFMNALFIDVFEASKFAIPFWIIIGLGVACLYEKNIKKA